MKIIKRAVYQMHEDGSFELLESDAYEYEGEVAKCFGGDSDTRSETNTTVETNQAGIEQVQGLGIASLGDVDLEIQTTDLGAVQGAFTFAQNFSDSAFDFANDIQATAADLSERAVETSQRALATVTTGGATDLAKINGKTIALVVVGILAIGFLPRLIRSK